MRYGYWLPVFGGWLRNVPDEGMSASWEYVKRLAQRSEQIGYDITLIAELFMNDIKGIDADSLEAWSTAAALAAVTEKLEAVGVDLLLLQFSPQAEEMERFSETVMPLVEAEVYGSRTGGWHPQS